MKYDKLYMDIARRVADESYAKRLKVGSAILTQNGALFVGFNGTLPGFINRCEKEDGSTDESITVHSEQNALYKMLREGVSAKGSTIYISHSPCEQCCKMLIASGIYRVVYGQPFRDEKPLDTLKQAGILVDKFEED
jgi:dCMP deaminase